MGLYEQALQKYKLQEEVRQNSQLNLPAGADSQRPQYVQMLDNLRRNQVYGAVAQSVNYQDPSLLDRAVAIPGRMAHQVAKGFVDSTADLVELPEKMVNFVGDQFGWNPEDRMNVLGNVAKSIRGAVDPVEGQQGIADKIAYYVGYSIPDLLGMLAGGMAGEATVGRGLAALSDSGILRVSEKTALSLGSAMGRISYGALKGAAMAGPEGAIHGAKQFTVMEAGMAALGRYNLATRVLGSAMLNGLMAAASTDSNRPDYKDEIIASSILGGMFAALPQHQQDKIAADPETAQAKVKAYIAGEQARGRTPELNGVLAEFAERDWDYLRAAYIQDPTATTPIADLKKNMENVYGQGKVSDDPDMMARQLGAMIYDQGNIESPNALMLAQNFVKTAQYLSNPDTIPGPAVIDKFVDAHRDMLIVPRKKSYEVINKQRVVDESGVTLDLTPEQARDWKIEKARQVIAEKGLAEANKRVNKPIKGWLTRTATALVNPEGEAFNKLTNIPMGEELQRQIRHKTYDVPGVVSEYERQVETAADFASFEGKSREVFDTLATIAWHEDKRSIWKAQNKNNPPELPWSEPLVEAKKQFAYKWIQDNEGPEGIQRYENALRVGFKSLQDLNIRKNEAGIISDKTLESYNANKYLPDQRAVRWRPNKTLYDVESSILLKNDPIFHETFGVSRIDPRLVGATGEPMVMDFEYLVKSEIRKQQFAIAKNNLLRTWWDAAQKGEGDIAQFARMPRFRYKVEGVDGFLDENQIKEITAINERLKRSAQNVRDRRNAKLESGEYSLRKKPTPTEPSLDAVKKETVELQKAVERLKTKDAKLTDWAMNDFDTYDVKSVQHIEERQDPKATQIYDETKAYQTAKSARDELRAQKEQLEYLTKMKKIEPVIDPMHGFEPVPFLKDGKIEYVMLDREAARLTNLNHNVTKLQQKLYRTASFASGVAPIKFFATAINPIFPIRRWWADNMHFYTANEYEGPNLLKFMKTALMEQPEVFKDVISNGKWATDYREHGGSRITMTKLGQEDVLMRNLDKLEMTEKGKQGWQQYADKMAWLGTNIEETIRVHQYKKMVEAGIDRDIAVRKVNDMLNFSRKGNFMRLVDTIYPFANVAAQALDAQVRAAREDPKLYAAKMSQYWALRLTGAFVAYTLAGKCMDQVSPYQKVNNFILPLGVSTKDENGDESHAFIAIPTDNSPIVRAIDAVLFAGIDIMRDKTNTLGYEEILKRVSDDVPIYNTGSFLPSIAAFRAAWRNRDPRTGDNIWKGNEYIDPSLRAYPDTSNLARAAARVLPGDVSPVGLQRAASMIGSNPLTSFMGYMLRDVSPEEKNSMLRTVTDAAPGMNSVFKWTRPQTAVIRTIQRATASARERKIGSLVDYAMDRIKEQGEPFQVVAKEMLAGDELNGQEKREALDQVKRSLKGWRVYKFYQDQQHNQAIYELPSYREWQAISGADQRAKARWYLATKPRQDDVSFVPYNELAKAFGFFRSPKFFYYLRQEEKNR